MTPSLKFVTLRREGGESRTKLSRASGGVSWGDLSSPEIQIQPPPLSVNVEVSHSP